jgi:hypothetical protein
LPNEDANTAEKRAEEAIKRHHDKIEFEETQGIIKIAWAYMVFCQSAEETSQNKILWEKITELINKKVFLIIRLMFIVANLSR